MKILVIRGKNLASLDGEFEIDFTLEPLRSAGIFAITGQTGAGKSTILDALCLALFDDAPRLNKAEIIKKEDLESLNDKISPQDCRNILRRGTSEGYAEVDFIALNSDKYRSRWVVRRARGKADGALQNTYMTLENLTNGIQEQGTKTDFLKKISELIGLTFHQFTRAVLLAQGDFANFLKARQNEKAELLEKLTGTEIYSDISMHIYRKTAEAKNSLDLTSQRIKDVKLLSEEEELAYKEEKEQLEKERAPLNDVKNDISKKLEWLQQKEQLTNDILNAEKELLSIRGKITEAATRYKYISRIETSLEIRDTYIDLCNKQEQVEKLVSAIELKEKELKDISEKALLIESGLSLAKKSLDEVETKYNTLKPELAKAKELDFKTESCKEKLSELNKEIQANLNQISKAEENISFLVKNETPAREKRDELLRWLTDNSFYEPIVPKTEYILSLIKNGDSLKKQQNLSLKGLESSKELLKTYSSQAEQYELEAEKLNKLLPTEILNLRNKLESGKPCPVCGSTHHPMHQETTQHNSIDESQLEAEKKKISDLLIQTNANIEKTKKGITEFEIHISNFRAQYENIYGELKDLLFNIPGWETGFKTGSLQDSLSNTIFQWKKNKEQCDKCIQWLENAAIRLEGENKNLDTFKNQLKEKEETRIKLQNTINELTAQRKRLLGNRQVEEVEEYYTKTKQENSRQYEQLRERKETAGKEKSAIEGILQQLRKDKEVNIPEIKRLENEVRLWLEKNSQQISMNTLKELVSKSHEWINSEKEYLNGLKNNELVCKTTYSERTERLNKHMESPHKPGDEQTKELLSQQLTELLEKTEIINKRLTEIDVLFLSHKCGKEQIKVFEKELTEKKELHENWAKLNDLLGSASGNKFKTLAQGYTLDVLLLYANKHLEDLTKRYKLEKIPGTLALQVIDNDMLGEARTAHSLSGGESFLISLALALGLSSLSSNRMKIESLFIDEGFGALDIDTLSIAMDALDNLQTQGRKICVISHVEEMKERITTQIRVVKSSNGKSVIRIVG